MARDAPDRVVFDTNTLISAFLFPQSVPGQAFNLVLANYQLLMSIETAAELANVIRRDKFDQFLTRQRREELVAATIRGSDFIETSSIFTACRDSSDNKFLELAVDGCSSAVVTGDTDLLVLHPFRSIPIITPRDFLSRLATE